MAISAATLKNIVDLKRRDLLREELFARVGRAEFAILCPEATADGARLPGAWPSASRRRLLYESADRFTIPGVPRTPSPGLPEKSGSGRGKPRRLRAPAILLLLSLAAAARGATFVVNSADDVDDLVCDATHCSLREALNAARNTAGANTILFSIGSGHQTIVFMDRSPRIDAPVMIDGSSQPGYAGIPLIEIVPGPHYGIFAALFIHASSVTVRGLMIHGFSNSCVDIEGSNNVIVGNYLGTDGVVGGPINSNGVQISVGSNNTVGGPNPGDGNVISGNPAGGVHIANASTGNVVTHNLIGTVPAGNASLPNDYGLIVGSSSDQPLPGPAVTADHNVISGNRKAGVYITSEGTQAVLTANWIGTDTSGTLAIPNAGPGIWIDILPSGNVVGGTGSGAANVIAFNSGPGILLSPLAGSGNSFRGNSIFGNLGIGIDLNGDGVTPNDPGDADNGPNGLQNYPVLTSVTTGGAMWSISGTLNSKPNASFQLDFYSNPPSGIGGNQGKTYLGSAPVTTDGSGNASFNVSFPAFSGPFITATATAADGSTSEISLAGSCCLPASPEPATLIPDGRATYTTMASSSALFQPRLVAGRSYSVEVDVPFDGFGTVGGGPSPTLRITRADGFTSLESVAYDQNSCAAAASLRATIRPTAADLAGGQPLVEVDDSTSSGYAFRIRLVETSQYCPRWSTNGYQGLIAIQNTTDCPVSGAVFLMTEDAAPYQKLPFLLPSFGTTELMIVAPLTFGSARLVHSGPPGAINAGTYMVLVRSDIPWANYRWPFLEVRAYGDSAGR